MGLMLMMDGLLRKFIHVLCCTLIRQIHLYARS